MDAPLSMNTLRIVLVGFTALAAVIALALGSFFVAAILTVSVLAHGGMWLWLAAKRREQADALHADVEDLLRQQG